MERFNEFGFLDPGIYPITFSELYQSILVRGEPYSLLPWDEHWRRQLVGHLEILANQLWTVGCTEIFIDGSFCSDKYHPNDIDGYFIADEKEFFNGNLVKKLNELDPYRCWGWNRQRIDEWGNYELEMWHRYRVELYPHCRGTYSGICNHQGQNMKFDEFFRYDRETQMQKGIIQLKKG